MGEVWPTTHITELYLFALTAGSGACERRLALTLQSQSCQRPMLTDALPLKLCPYGALQVCVLLLLLLLLLLFGTGLTTGIKDQGC